LFVPGAGGGPAGRKKEKRRHVVPCSMIQGQRLQAASVDLNVTRRFFGSGPSNWAGGIFSLTKQRARFLWVGGTREGGRRPETGRVKQPHGVQAAGLQFAVVQAAFTVLTFTSESLGFCGG